MKLVLLTFMLIFCNVSLSQERLNVLVSVNNNIAGSFNLSNSFLLVHNDTINLVYKMGRFEINTDDFAKLNKYCKEEDVFLNFNFFESCPYQKTYSFKLKLKLDLLLQEYLFLKVYNFSTFPKAFISKTGYGFEYVSPLRSSVLPKNKKLINHSCSD